MAGMLPDSGILIAREHDSAALARALRKGEVERLRPGAYRVVDGRADRPPSSDVAARMVALHRQLRAPHVFSHVSAAVVWGLRTWTVPARTHVVQPYRASSQAADDVVRHFVALGPGDRTERRGLPVTTLTRTVVDCALTLHPLEALVVVDSALASGLDRDAALDMLARRGRAPGRRRARVVLGLGDGGAESAWETWLRYVALRAGLPRPVTQYAVETRLGRFRADLGWPDHGVLAEFDGRVKYRDGAFGPGYDADAARCAEKRRADAIEEATGRSILRVTASDRPDDVAARLRRRFPPELQAATRTTPLLPPVPPR
jgi:hypothetical protein